MTSPSEPRACERCLLPAVESERFCKECRKAFILEMESSGYLQRRIAWPKDAGKHRPPDARENVRETKYGID